MKSLLLSLLIASTLLAQDRKVEATWLHRYLPDLREVRGDLSSKTCHYKPVFGEGDADSRILRSVVRFAEVMVDAHGNCQSTLYDREEEIYFVQEGKGTLHYGDGTYAMRQNDFTYLPPGVKHSIGNSSEQTLRVFVMGFKIPDKTQTGSPSPHPKIVNLDDVKEETVDGHPSSVLYKLLAGPHTAKRDAIDEAYVVTSFFWMDFAPGGTNVPHHHETQKRFISSLKVKGKW